MEPRVVLVTGGGGANMGQAISRRLAQAGDSVIVSDLSSTRAKEVADEIVGEGYSAQSMKLDITDPIGCDKVIGEIIAERGQIDVLCLHAGGGAQNSAMHVTDQDMEKAFALNLTGNVALLRASLRHMVERKSGVVVVTISEAGLRGGAGGFSYTIMKHAMVGLVRHVAWTYAPFGIRCNAICPGLTFGESMREQRGGALEGALRDDTRPDVIIPRMIEHALRAGLTHPIDAEARVKVVRTAPRTGTPEEIAEVVHFVTSPAASFLNGAIIPVDAGWSAG